MWVCTKMVVSAYDIPIACMLSTFLVARKKSLEYLITSSILGGIAGVVTKVIIPPNFHSYVSISILSLGGFIRFLKMIGYYPYSITGIITLLRMKGYLSSNNRTMVLSESIGYFCRTRVTNTVEETTGSTIIMKRPITTYNIISALTFKEGLDPRIIRNIMLIRDILDSAISLDRSSEIIIRCNHDKLVTIKCPDIDSKRVMYILI